MECVWGCMCWDVLSVVLEVEGKVGLGEKFTFDVDVGSYYVSVSRLELKIDFDYMWCVSIGYNFLWFVCVIKVMSCFRIYLKRVLKVMFEFMSSYLYS